MKTQIDLKSALLGLALGVLAMLAIGAETSSNPVGRYQISTGVNSSVIVDTTTGKAWAFQPIGTQQFKLHENFWDAK